MAIDGVEVEEDSKGVAATIEGGWGEQKDDGNVSYTRMLKFILPTLGIWLSSPIMSLVDAGVVGEFGGDGVQLYCRARKLYCIRRRKLP